MSDQFWIALFGFLTAIVSALGGISMLMLRNLGKELVKRDTAAQQDRSFVLGKVNSVEAQVCKATDDLAAAHLENVEFQNVVLSSDVFDGSKLREFAQKRRSGFGPLDP